MQHWPWELKTRRVAIFGQPVEAMSKTTFYFSISVMVIVDIAQGQYQKKLDIEPFDVEDTRARRPRRRDDEPGERGDREEREFRPREASAERPRRAAAPAADPFFDKPYEPTGSGEAAWETADNPPVASPATAPAGGANRVSPSLRPKKKVAALLGGSSR